MPEDARSHWQNFLRSWEGRTRWHLRRPYIAYREEWRDTDHREALATAKSMARLLGEDYLAGRSVEQAADDEWKLKLQRLALEVLHVYKAPIPVRAG